MTRSERRIVGCEDGGEEKTNPSTGELPPMVAWHEGGMRKRMREEYHRKFQRRENGGGVKRRN